MSHYKGEPHQGHQTNRTLGIFEQNETSITDFIEI